MISELQPTPASAPAIVASTLRAQWLSYLVGVLYSTRMKSLIKPA